MVRTMSREIDRWHRSERAAERAAIQHQENPPIPQGYYDQYGDWHAGWFAYPQYARDVDARLAALRGGRHPQPETDIFSGEQEHPQGRQP